MNATNRRKAIGMILGSTSALFLGISEGANKKKGKGKGKGKKKKNDTNEAKKLSGTIILTKENITNTYKLAGGKIYSFAKAVENKVKSFEGKKVTVYGRVEKDRIVTIEAITSS